MCVNTFWEIKVLRAMLGGSNDGSKTSLQLLFMETSFARVVHYHWNYVPHPNFFALLFVQNFFCPVQQKKNPVQQKSSPSKNFPCSPIYQT